LNLDNLTKREIRPVLGERFKGWKPFRSGLVGILFDAGVDVEVAKVILRHSDSSVTRRHYLHLKSQKQGKAAMKSWNGPSLCGTNTGQPNPRKSREVALRRMNSG